MLLGIFTGLVPLVVTVLNKNSVLLPFSIYFVIFSAVIITLLTYKKHKNPFYFMSVLITGAVYIGLCSSFFILLRYLPMGREWIFFLMTVIFLGDAGAYYVGKGFGKHKLYPAVSSGKTVEGALGGVLFNIVGAVLIWLIFFQNSPLLLSKLIVAAVIIGLTGQVGDLAESIIKRCCGVKDSSHILPGHGGIFDRLDALLLACPLFYCMLFCELITT